jgi:hypothetical protein
MIERRLQKLEQEIAEIKYNDMEIKAIKNLLNKNGIELYQNDGEIFLMKDNKFIDSVKMFDIERE